LQRLLRKKNDPGRTGRVPRPLPCLSGRTSRVALFAEVLDDTALTFGPRAVPLPLLDLAPGPAGGTANDALRATIDLAWLEGPPDRQRRPGVCFT
jgi:hypothetical protein